jgi:PAS domain S-box-containing protein
MTRQVHELGQRDYGLRGHITSLTPLRPENGPDAWERAALLRFAQGEREVTSLEHDQQVPVLRHMRALVTEPSCLKCHGHQDYRVGDVRGGLSIAVPLDGYYATAWSGLGISAVLHAAIWLLGLAALALGHRSLSRRIIADRLAQRRYRDLVETSHDLIWQLDAQGRIAYMNPAWERSLGHPVAAMTGRPFTDFKDPSDIDRGRAAFRRMMADGGNLLDQESVFLHRDGRQVHLIINARPLRDAQGRIVGCSGTAFDSSERRRLEERLRQSEKMLAVGQLAGGVAHDFNNQLAGILGFAELMAKRSADPASRRYAEQITTAAQRAADLTGKLLAFSRKGAALAVPVDLHACIHETIALLARTLPPGIAIREDLQAPAAQVRGDPTQLQSALLNLAINARDAMPDGGALTFATRRLDLAAGGSAELPAGGYLELTVADTGCGMDERVRAHLFEPFFTTKAPGKGTGMGLASVYGTVAGHGGRIQVDSAPGHGSAFRILLPLLAAEAVASPPTPAEPPAIPRLRILVVDDEAVVRDILAELLRADGHEVATAADGVGAVAALRARPDAFDLVVCDMMMPEMDGRSCFRELRAIAPGIRVLLASGYSADGAVQELLADGAAGFVQKPFRRIHLRQALAEAMRPRP